MSENELKPSLDVEKRLDQMEHKLGIVYSDDANTLKELYTSPKTILMFVTLLNIGLFIGGTVYTGIQVKSIQERYQEAAQKINDAQQKYNEAETKLKQIQTIAEETKGTLRDVQRQAGELVADVQKKSKESGTEITQIRTQAEQQLELLKKSGASTIAAMTAYQRDAENAVAKSAQAVEGKIQEAIKTSSDAVNKNQTSIDALGSQIGKVSVEVKQKELELSKIQTGLQAQLSAAEKLNDEFTSKIKAIARTDKITIPVLFEIADVWLKLVFGLVILALLIAVTTSILVWRRYRRTNRTTREPQVENTIEAAEKKKNSPQPSGFLIGTGANA